jgi:hypothetical protein
MNLLVLLVTQRVGAVANTILALLNPAILKIIQILIENTRITLGRTLSWASSMLHTKKHPSILTSRRKAPFWFRMTNPPVPRLPLQVVSHHTKPNILPAKENQALDIDPPNHVSVNYVLYLNR